jgi:hypothetical protein
MTRSTPSAGNRPSREDRKLVYRAVSNGSGSWPLWIGWLWANGHDGHDVIRRARRDSARNGDRLAPHVCSIHPATPSTPEAHVHPLAPRGQHLYVRACCYQTEDRSSQARAVAQPNTRGYRGAGTTDRTRGADTTDRKTLRGSSTTPAAGPLPGSRTHERAANPAAGPIRHQYPEPAVPALEDVEPLAAEGGSKDGRSGVGPGMHPQPVHLDGGERAWLAGRLAGGAVGTRRMPAVGGAPGADAGSRDPAIRAVGELHPDPASVLLHQHYTRSF